MEKFTKLREGDFWVLNTQTEWGPMSEGLLITKTDIDYVTLYLWGVATKKNIYSTPKDFLVSTVCKIYNSSNAEELVEKKFIEPPEQSLGIYVTEVNKGTSRAQSVCGLTPGEAIMNGVHYLSNSVLIEIINENGLNHIVPVYCLKGNPEDLTTEEECLGAQQIGYAVVDMTKLKQMSYSLKPEEAVEDYLETRDIQGTYGYEYYIWDEDTQTWDFQDSEDGFVGDDPTTNGLFDEFEIAATFWGDAYLDSWGMAELLEEEDDEDEDEDDEDDIEDEDEEDIEDEDEDEDGFFINEEVM